MKFFDRLKTIGVDVSKLTSINLLKINFTIDRSVHIDNSKSTLEINPAIFNGKQRRQIKTLLREQGLLEAGAILDSKETEIVDLVRSELPALQADISKFQAMIPVADLALLHACLYLRARFRSGNHVDDLKAEISKVYGQRGRNFSNLCTAGYLEDWFLPLYAELQSRHPGDPITAKSKFIGIYNTIVSELPWTVFICSSTSKPKAVSTVVGKINRNIQNGVRFLNLHGLGEKNSKKIASILPEIQKETGAIAAKMEQDTTRIFVRLEVPQT